jgi:hypothetical protein
MARFRSRTGARALALGVGAVALVAGVAACLGGVNRVYDEGGGPASSDGSIAQDGVGAEDDVVTGAEAGDDGSGAQGDGPAGEAATADGGSADAPHEAEAGAVFTCNGQPVTSCATCPANPVECVFCATDGGHPLVCGPKMYCQNVTPPGASVCSCPGNNVAACAASTQVCTPFGLNDYCQVCGETGSGNHPCKGGGTCDEASGACK